MPDIPNRDELERQYGRVMASILRRQMGELLELMGDPPDLSKVPPDFWARHGKEAEAKLRPFGEKVYLEAAERMLAEVPIGVDYTLVNEAAMRWANRYTFDLVTDLTDTSRRGLQQAVSGYFREGQTLAELQAEVASFKDRAGRLFGPTRAEMIARTEVTRAAVEGQRAAVRESDAILQKYGIKPMVEVWRTRNDELVCPICGPRHGKKEGDGWQKGDGPPAHPRCRCWTGFQYPGRKRPPRHEFYKKKEQCPPA